MAILRIISLKHLMNGKYKTIFLLHKKKMLLNLQLLEKLCWRATSLTTDDALNACQRGFITAPFCFYWYAVMQKSVCEKNVTSDFWRMVSFFIGKWVQFGAAPKVNYIRRRLAENNIHYCWTTIKEKMCSMQSSIVSADNDNNEKLYIKLCTRPTKDQNDIFTALNFRERPFVRKTKLVPQM